LPLAPIAMNVLLQTASANVAEWHSALREALPEAEITVWPQLPRAIDYMALWKPPPELFVCAPAARAIFNLGAGVDALLAIPTLPAGIPVIRLEDCGMAAQMSDYIALATLAAFREQYAYASQQRDAVWTQRPLLARSEFGVGFLGFGLLARTAAERLAPFGFPLAGWSRNAKSVRDVAHFAGLAELSAFLARTRVLVCLLPATPATRDFLDRTRLALLPRGAHVVNVARGDVVVDADLVAALDSGHLAGATLDVFRTEPLPPAHPFWHHPRITVTPHVSALTLPAESAAQVAAKIRRLERGLDVTGVVDRTHGY